MEKRSVFVPGHISGFFQVCDEPKDPARKGSRNCGPCIDAGVTTTVEVEEGPETRVEILIDEEEKSAKTTRTAIMEILRSNEWIGLVKVQHSLGAPLEAGYGMSGAGSLGAVLALSEALNSPLDRSEATSVAHKAEVTCKSGLGDVGAQILGGLVIGLEPGAPLHGKWERIETRENLKFVCGTFGPLSTSEILEKENFRKKTKELGKTAMRDLISDKTVENFMEVSRKFAFELRVLDEKFEEILEEISFKSPLGASAIMLGRAIFAPAPPSKVNDLKKVFLDYFDLESIMVTSIDFEGARILG
ncbi:hypothetical protein AKJ57_00625 [candidate division MSBL1 archaeon SCGC-AAA259A05]|uniref:Pantoate kinase n=1 Tax=candidate division MSBL1 archaeon SCGC-AAA259A05 TaxID=1698259 RepID=A0A133UBP2_9EURY|nr:hypothetical protein AKJ57_00625 [candidate division MSBL1 archaeon SCGC-AAA259A05]